MYSQFLVIIFSVAWYSILLHRGVVPAMLLVSVVLRNCMCWY